MPIEFAPPQANLQGFNIPGPQYTDPLETLARMQQMRTQGIQQQQATLGLQQAQQQMMSNRAMMNAFVQGAGDTKKTRDLMVQSGQVLPDQLIAFDNHVLQRDTNQATLTEKQQTIRKTFADTVAGAYKAGIGDQGALNAANTDLRSQGVPDNMLITAFPAATPDHSSQDQIEAYANSHLMDTQRQEKELKAEQIKREKVGTAAEEAKTTETQQTIAKGQIDAALREIQMAPKDPNDKTGTVPIQDAWNRIVATYPKANLQPTATPEYISQLKTSMVPVKEQPDYAIDLMKANSLKTMNEQDWANYITRVVPDTNSPLYHRTLSMVQFYRNQGNLKAADDAVKAAGEQLGKTESAVATARATAPIKIDVGTAMAAAKADQAGLTDDDYQRAGEQYARTGVMPAVGRDSITRGRIVRAGNQWARDNGLNAGDVVQMQAAYAGDKDSLKKFQSQRDQIVSFEQTAQKNLDLFLREASKIPDTGVPWLNRPLRELDKNIVGSANMAAVDAARQIANNEIAKVTSGGGLGGVLSDSARNEVSGYNPASATFGQTLRVAQILKQDMANRHQSMDATLSDIKGRIGGGPAPGGASTAGHVINVNGKRYRYKGSGNTADLSNYTEIQ